LTTKSIVIVFIKLFQISTIVAKIRARMNPKKIKEFEQYN